MGLFKRNTPAPCHRHRPPIDSRDLDGRVSGSLAAFKFAISAGLKKQIQFFSERSRTPSDSFISKNEGMAKLPSNMALAAVLPLNGTLGGLDIRSQTGERRPQDDPKNEIIRFCGFTRLDHRLLLLFTLVRGIANYAMVWPIILNWGSCLQARQAGSHRHFAASSSLRIRSSS